MCVRPLKGWRSSTVGPNGKRGIVFNRKDAFVDMPVDVACGNCMQCRLKKSKMWALRCMHEASLHKENMFLTLTYSDEYLPENANLVKEDFQKFMKRLRKHLKNVKVRYYHCGEYGKNNPEDPKHRETYKISNLGRPHFHALIFGYRFTDGILAGVKDGNRLFVSKLCEKLWPFGYNRYGDVNFKSAGYVARYCTKKINGVMKEEHYQRICPETGHIVKLNQEYTTMSRRDGIGKGWYDKFKYDLYPKDFVTVGGLKVNARSRS